MSEGIDAYIKKKFEVPDVDIRTYSPLTLAYIGDGVFDLVIRSVVVGKGNTRPNQLHHRTSQIVKAHTQAVIIQYLEPMLTEEEADIYRRGRNAKSATMVKMQLSDLASWNVKSYAVTGKGGSSTTYSMPTKRSYVMYPDEVQVKYAEQLVNKVVEGQILTDADLEIPDNIVQ